MLRAILARRKRSVGIFSPNSGQPECNSNIVVKWATNVMMTGEMRPESLIFKSRI
jgi:hypothetical protein